MACRLVPQFGEQFGVGRARHSAPLTFGGRGALIELQAARARSAWRSAVARSSAPLARVSRPPCCATIEDQAARSRRAVVARSRLVRVATTRSKAPLQRQSKNRLHAQVTRFVEAHDAIRPQPVVHGAIEDRAP